MGHDAPDAFMMQALLSPTWNLTSGKRSTKGSKGRANKHANSSPRDSTARQSSSNFSLGNKGIYKNFPGKSISK